MSNLPKRIIEKYGQSDLFLYCAGGCHVFARVLLQMFPDENYELRHLRAKIGTSEIPGYHVYAYSSGFAVDALGVKREEDLIAYMQGRRPGTLVFPEPVDLEFLFKVHDTTEDTGPRNEWRMFLHSEYVSYLDAKARLLILDERARYSVSTIQRGAQITK